jgi:hypothetical protein
MGISSTTWEARTGLLSTTSSLEASWHLQDGDYLRVGNCIYRYLAGGNIEAEYHEEIYRLTIQDGLTRIHNQRALTEFLDREVARSLAPRPTTVGSHVRH